MTAVHTKGLENVESEEQQTGDTQSQNLHTPLPPKSVRKTTRGEEYEQILLTNKINNCYKMNFIVHLCILQAVVNRSWTKVTL